MKIRNGFVSNSSSSSFVVVGVKRNGDSEEIMENESFGNKIRSLYIDEKDFDFVTGVVISDNDELDRKSITFGELHEMANNVANALNVDINEVSLITGTRYC